MHRLLAMFAALALTAVTVSSACTAAPPAGALGFILEGGSSGDRLQARFRKEGRSDHNWSSSFAVSELAGLDLARFRSAAPSPIAFAIVREPGRLDCSGNGGNSLARGTCRVTADAAFLQLLDRHGIARPTEEETYGLISLDVRRDLVEALAAARYPTPSVNDLMSLTAVGVTSRYVGELANAGYRPQSLETLLEFAALGIEPDYIRGFARIGYGTLAAGDLVQLKALGIMPDYVAGFQRLGYRDLPARSLVEMKALGITPEFARSIQRKDGALPSPDRLVEMRALAMP